MNVVHFLNPWAAWFALSIPAIIILYMLKMRRREIEVPSTLLWRQVLKDARANAPWQKLTRNLLLFLQILIALALVFALLRPSLMTAGTRGRNLVVLLDASASMQAVDVSPSRFDAAKKEVMALINEMGAGDTMTIIKMAALPEVVARATSDKSVLKKRLNEVTVTGEEANLAPALSLASSLVKGMEKPLTVIVSDGNLGKIPPHTPLPPEIVHIKVGKADDNLTLTPPATRREGNATVTMVRVVNNGSKDVVTTVELWVDGKLFDARAVALKAGEGKNLYWTDIPEDARLLMARSTYPDMLPHDNTGWAVVENNMPAKVLLVSRGNLFLEKILSLSSFMEAARTTPEQYAGGAGYHLVIFDGWLPPVLPEANLMIFDPPEGNPFIPSGGYVQGANLSLAEGNDPLLKYVDFSDVHVAVTRKIGNLPGGKVLVRNDLTPLIMVGALGKARVAVFGFDLHQSDLPLRTAFPILMQNMLTWLLPQWVSGGDQLFTGETVVINTVPQAERLLVKKPGGRTIELPVSANTRFQDTDEAGVYTVVQEWEDGKIIRHFAVNTRRGREAIIRPREIELPVNRVTTDRSQRLTNKELWRYGAWLALLVLVLEGWVYARGY